MEVTENLQSWVTRKLAEFLGTDCASTADIASYILSIQNPKDLEEYLVEFLDKDSKSHQDFIKFLIKKKKFEKFIPVEDIEVHQTQDKSKPVTGSSSSDKFTVSQGLPVYEQQARNRSVALQKFKDITHVENVSPPSAGKQKKSKFVPLFSEEGHSKSVAKLPGRHRCDCLAAKHSLINNCLKCGRIVCDQEGSGPCMFCGSLVCTKEEQEILSRGSKKSEKLYERLSNQGGKREQEGLEKAKEHKDKLLEYDKTSVKRTQVIDDESDYFTTESNVWLSEKERLRLKKQDGELRALKYASRKDRKITFDFAGRQVLEASDDIDLYDRNDEAVQEVYYGQYADGRGQEPVFKEEDFMGIAHPDVQRPLFVESEGSQKISKPVLPQEVKSSFKGLRLQDAELQMMRDEGMCLSMHQPWASLLVSGVKKHEGRTWYTTHRGRLWIAAASKLPSPEEIQEAKTCYTYLHNSDQVNFPKDYPVGCLLGCVTVIDCLSQEEYRRQFPDGESQSPYVFICENSQELVVKYPMKGKHKIYKLDHNLHQGAKKCLKY